MWATIADWATTVDHKKIGVMYLFAILFMFFLGGAAAIAVRIELFEPTRTELLADGTTRVVGQAFAAAGATSINEGNLLYNRIFTLHGLIMVFLVIVPSIPASLGNFLLPLMVGAKDVAFPKLNLLSWYIYLFGSLFAVIAAIGGGVETGWTFYT
ncbi:MAG: cbb3-type cytochrome c oxidase subunit I, partial [bacterium]